MQGAIFVIDCKWHDFHLDKNKLKLNIKHLICKYQHCTQKTHCLKLLKNKIVFSILLISFHISCDVSTLKNQQKISICH